MPNDDPPPSRATVFRRSLYWLLAAAVAASTLNLVVHRLGPNVSAWLYFMVYVLCGPVFTIFGIGSDDDGTVRVVFGTILCGLLALILAHPLRPSPRTARLTRLGVALWFLLGCLVAYRASH